MAKSQDKTKEPDSTPQYIYCGPNWLKHGLLKYQVFINGFSYTLKEAMKERPEISELVCWVDELDSLRRKIETKGTRESNMYEIVENYIRKGNK